jgi:non-homologous end joining protein Ku
VIALIEAKARGEEPELPEPGEMEAAPDLMAALEASLKGARKAGSNGGSSRGKARS